MQSPFEGLCALLDQSDANLGVTLIELFTLNLDGRDQIKEGLTAQNGLRLKRDVSDQVSVHFSFMHQCCFGSAFGPTKSLISLDVLDLMQGGCHASHNLRALALDDEIFEILCRLMSDGRSFAPDKG